MAGTLSRRIRSAVQAFEMPEADRPEETGRRVAGPVKPKRRNGKPQPASLSMFEWAMEQEAETVGAGR